MQVSKFWQRFYCHHQSIPQKPPFFANSICHCVFIIPIIPMCYILLSLHYFLSVVSYNFGLCLLKVYTIFRFLYYLFIYLFYFWKIKGIYYIVSRVKYISEGGQTPPDFTFWLYIWFTFAMIHFLYIYYFDASNHFT